MRQRATLPSLFGLFGLLGLGLALALPSARAEEAAAFEGAVTFLAKDKKGIQTTIIHYLKDGRSRMEITGQMGLQAAMIMDPKDKISYVLIPQQKMYMERPLGEPAQQKGAQRDPGTKPQKTGKTDTVAGIK